MYADFIAGWVAGGTGLIVGHPFDTVKTRLQTMSNYGGILDCVRKTIQKESVFGLYKGMWAPFLSTGALQSILFTSYGAGLRILHPGELNITDRKDLPITDIIAASIFGALIAVTPEIPVELIKTKLQVQKENICPETLKTKSLYRGPADCAIQTFKQEGLRGLFKGGNVMVVRNLIGYVAYIPVYELMLRNAKKRNINETLAQLLSGGIAGSVSWFSICPFEVVKNNIQTSKTAKKQKMLEVARRLFQNEGANAFFRGGLTLVIRGFLVNSILFVVYENTLSLVQDAL
ncbi:unnamed protein product [Auanema sp. JU1783]|nr:unnamed protein product [Auanema sp. JU1783]